MQVGGSGKSGIGLSKMSLNDGPSGFVGNQEQ